MTRFLFLLAFAASAFSASAGEDATFKTVDANQDGFVSESEFVSWKTSAGDMSPAEALVLFIEIDADASGMISEAEMAAAQAATSEHDSASSGADDSQM
nr:EF-hand domain-containing protein [Hyphomonas sp. Mor2]